MRYSAGKFAGVLFWALCAALIVTSFRASVIGQSTDIEFPTAITENQINGVIKARDIGDPRVTNFYYTFNGLQGDLFVNIVTKNLSGSVDVFLSDGMRPLSNILVYADVAQNETGRVIYLRKPEKLILRVQGRTPNDDPAEFQIKFAGGFEAATPSKEEPPVPKVTGVGENNNSEKVNSVGTILAVTPKPKPTPNTAAAEIARIEQRNETAKSVDETSNAQQTPETKSEEKPADNTGSKSNSSETVERSASATTGSSAKTKTTGRRPTRTKTPQADTTSSNTSADVNDSDARSNEKNAKEPKRRSKPEVVITDTTSKVEPPAKSEPPAAKPNPLANVRLVILFKDGSKVERPMTDIFRFTADQSTLTVVGTNGRVSKFPILDVVSVTIQ